MDNDSDKDPRPRSWANSGWRRAAAIGPGEGDPSQDGLVAGTLDEQRSFGAPAGTVSLGHVLARDTHGPHEVWAHAAGRDLSVTQLTPQPCRGHLLRANLGDMGFDAGAFDGDLRVRGVMAQKAFSLVSVMEQEGVLNQWGHRIEEGDIVAIPPDRELDGRFQGRLAYAVVTAPWGLVMQRAEAFEWLADPSFWTEPAIYSPPPEARAACKRVLQGCASLLRVLAGGAPSSTVAFLRDELLDGVLTALAAVRAEGGRRQGVLNAARIVRGAEDFLESGGARQAVQIEDLCLALNISRRTLYRAFHDLLDISPKAYLRLKSMSAARARLLDAGDRPTTVTQAALDQGFWELGRFSGAYRAMFGESPSETLRAAQGRQP
ncbi:helix-turn-helix domain-containing protein [Caulobacter sp. LjRoot300]|uniref:helix-turn-helix domain-containing protein n=1 Tax=Caulobacter sp. LjRoot300 TaxID=3342321 RepID=UPI003ECCA1FD